MKATAFSAMRTLPHSVWWLSGATLINRMGAMVFPFLVLYFHRDLKLDLGTATGIAAFYGIGSGCSAPLGGWLADRYDAVKLFAWSMLLAGVFLLLFPLVKSPGPLMLATFLIALATDLSRPSSLTALARLVGSEQSRDAFALNYLAINLGMSVGPVLGGYLAMSDYRFLFWVDGASSLVAGLLLLVSGTRSPAVVTPTQKPDWNVGAPAFRLLILLSLSSWVLFTFFVATPLYLVEVLQRPESSVGWLWLLNTGLIVLTTVHVTHWTRGKTLSLQLGASALCFALGYALLLVLPGVHGLVLCMLMLTLGEMMLFTNGNSYLREVVPEHKMGRAMALNSMSFSLALACSTPAMGYFFTTGTPSELWAILALTALVAALGYFRLPVPVVSRENLS